MTTVVLVHGAWHGPWCWDMVRAGLDERAIPTVAPELPLTSLADDAAALRDVLDRLDDDTVVVGHYYGGSVVTLGAIGAERVRHLVYLCAFMIEPGLPVKPDGRPLIQDAVQVRDDWTTIDPAHARGAFYGDVPPDLTAVAVERLRPFAALPR
jgi:homoserine acetyltransferase